MYELFLLHFLSQRKIQQRNERGNGSGGPKDMADDAHSKYPLPSPLIIFDDFNNIDNNDDLVDLIKEENSYSAPEPTKKYRKSTSIFKLNEEERSFISGCIGPNTVLSQNGCACAEGFVGSPGDARGCWRCKERCSIGEVCGYGGICTCLHGYGLNESAICVPTNFSIEYLSPERTLVYKPQKISIQIHPKSYSNVLYCRFGDMIVRASKGCKDGRIMCDPPLVRKPQLVELKVSNSKDIWPAHGVPFEYVEQIEQEWNVKNALALMFSMITTVSSAILFGHILVKAGIYDLNKRRQAIEVANIADKKQIEV